MNSNTLFNKPTLIDSMVIVSDSDEAQPSEHFENVRHVQRRFEGNPVHRDRILRSRGPESAYRANKRGVHPRHDELSGKPTIFSRDIFAQHRDRAQRCGNYCLYDNDDDLDNNNNKGKGPYPFKCRELIERKRVVHARCRLPRWQKHMKRTPFSRFLSRHFLNCIGPLLC